MYPGLIETEITTEPAEVVVAEVTIKELVIIFVVIALIYAVYVVEALLTISEVL